MSVNRQDTLMLGMKFVNLPESTLEYLDDTDELDLDGDFMSGTFFVVGKVIIEGEDEFGFDIQEVPHITDFEQGKVSDLIKYHMNIEEPDVRYYIFTTWG